MFIFQFLFLFIFITVNILLGCYIAILSGYGPPDWETALNQVVDLARLKDYLKDFQSRILRRHEVKDEVPTTLETNTTKTAPSEHENFEDAIRKLTEIQPSDISEDISSKISQLSPPNENPNNEPAKDQSAQAWLEDEKHAETSLLKLNSVIMTSSKFAAELDWRIRSFRGAMTQEDVKQFRDELREDCRNYLEAQASITDQMKKRLNEFGELKNLAEKVDYANMEQSAQIETTLSNLELIDANNNPEDAATRLIKEISSLRLARHRLRDMQDKTFLQIVFFEKREDTIPSQLYIDENSGMRGRIGLEVAVNEWWKQKLNQKRQITFALLDFVKFGEANEEHGIMACNKLIKFFGNYLKEHFDPLDLTGIYCGNCFMVATLNAGPKKTITEIERLRQHWEKTTCFYDSRKSSMKLELTCAITEGLATQSQNEVLDILEKTLATAKKAGRNHTYHFVPGPLDNPPKKIDAPNLGEIGSEVDI